MKPKSKLYFGENTSSEKFPQTSSNDFPEHKKYTKLKTNNIKDIYSLKNGKKKKNIKTQTKQHNNKIPNTMKSTKSLSFTYRYFDIGTKNKFRSLRDKSFGIKSIKENNTMRSNFIPLSNEANKYTSNANYIKNKRMQIFDISQLDRKSQTVFSESVKTNKNDKKFLYKTTIFRIGKYFLKRIMEKLMEIYTPSIIISVANNVEDMAKKQMIITIMKFCVKAPAKCLAPTATARAID